MPSIDAQKLSRELAAIVSRPEYSLALATELTRPRQTGLPNALRFAEFTIAYAFGRVSAPRLMDPIVVKNLQAGSYPRHLYRVFDGVEGAKTLGAWWGERKLLKRCVHLATLNQHRTDHGLALQEMLKAMYVHPNWNRGTDIACLTIPAGSSTPAIIGQGDWRAMRAASKSATDPLTIDSEQDVRDKLGMDPAAGAPQYFLPFVNAMWVTKIPHRSQGWPFS